jgi:hypothetical protein
MVILIAPVKTAIGPFREIVSRLALVGNTERIDGFLGMVTTDVQKAARPVLDKL